MRYVYNFFTVAALFCFLGTAIAQARTCEELFSRGKMKKTKESSQKEVMIGLDDIKDAASYQKVLKKIVAQGRSKGHVEQLFKEFNMETSMRESFESIIQKMSHYEKENALWSELELELKILQMMSQNFSKLFKHNNDFLNSRGHSTDDIEFILYRIEDRVNEIVDLNAKALNVSGFKIRDLFDVSVGPNQRRIDGVTIMTRVNIIKWLQGEHKDISTPKEIKHLIKRIGGMEAKLSRECGWRTCLTYNPQGAETFKNNNFFVVREILLVGNNPLWVDHTFLRFYPADGSPSIIIDFSFNQFKLVPDGLFVGTDAELNRFTKKHSMNKTLNYFHGSDENRFPMDQGVNSLSIGKIREQLQED